MSLPFTHAVELAAHNLIKGFIERRQETVIQALITLRPDIIRAFKLENALGLNPQELYQHIASVETSLREGTFQWTGIWKNTWAYRLHGIGCKLVNLETDERFDWDAGDPDIFFTGELWSYLKWQTETQPEASDVKIYFEWGQNSGEALLDLLQHFLERGLIATPFPHEWKLIKPSTPDFSDTDTTW